MNQKTSLKLWLQLAKSSAKLQTQVNARFRTDYNQSLARFDVLSQLARAEEKSLSVSILSAALIASSGNITRLLDRMQNEGLLQRKPSPHDLRGVTIHITPKGITLFDQMAADHEKWIDDMFGHMPKEQQTNLLEHLIALQNNLHGFSQE